jgi:hypothetical protein
MLIYIYQTSNLYKPLCPLGNDKMTQDQNVIDAANKIEQELHECAKDITATLTHEIIEEILRQSELIKKSTLFEEQSFEAIYNHIIKEFKPEIEKLIETAIAEVNAKIREVSLADALNRKLKSLATRYVSPNTKTWASEFTSQKLMSSYKIDEKRALGLQAKYSTSPNVLAVNPEAVTKFKEDFEEIITDLNLIKQAGETGKAIHAQYDTIRNRVVEKLNNALREKN